jgi:hypothetical protein
LLGVVGKGRINFLYLGGIERPLALDHCSADLRLFTALFHQGLPLLNEFRTALRRGSGHAKQKNSECNNQITKHAAASSSLDELPSGSVSSVEPAHSTPDVRRYSTKYDAIMTGRQRQERGYSAGCAVSRRFRNRGMSSATHRAIT